MEQKRESEDQIFRIQFISLNVHPLVVSSLQCFVYEHYNLVSGNFGCLPFLDIWVASVHYYLDDGFRSRVIEIKCGLRPTISL